MSAGTIALTNKSTSVTGTGTSFTSELKAGDFIGVTVGGAPYTLIVASVTSDSALILSSAFDGPTASGVAWYCVPASLKYAITQQALNDMSKILRNIILEKENWQAVFSEAGDITVKLSDGSTLSGPSWKKIVDLLEAVNLEEVQQLADQVRDDAQQVSADKATASTAATNASNSATSAGSSATAAQTAKTSAESANTSAQQAKTDAVAAKTAAETAAANVATLAQVDAHLEALQTSTAWVNMTLANGWTAQTQLARYRKINGKLEIAMYVTGGTKTDGTTITTLPAGYITKTQRFLLATSVITSGSYPPRVYMNTDGTIKLYSVTADPLQVVGEIDLS